MVPGTNLLTKKERLYLRCTTCGATWQNLHIRWWEDSVTGKEHKCVEQGHNVIVDQIRMREAV